MQWRWPAWSFASVPVSVSAGAEVPISCSFSVLVAECTFSPGLSGPLGAQLFRTGSGCVLGSGLQSARPSASTQQRAPGRGASPSSGPKVTSPFGATRMRSRYRPSTFSS